MMWANDRDTNEPVSVLVVEDERVVARDIADSLTAMGFEVTGTAPSADEAIAQASRRCPDLVLMDVRIDGDRDGIETARLLRERFGVGVVFLTAYADQHMVERAKAVEPQGYLVKPFRENELRAVLEVALYKHRMEAKLQARERWFSTTLRAIADAVIAVDARGGVRFLNVAAEALLGVRSAHASGKPIWEIVRLADEKVRNPIEKSVHAALEERAVAHEPRISLAGADGERSIDGRVAPIVGDRGELIGAVVVLRDLSEQRRLEQQIVLADRLASLGTLAAGVAHEINNPLTYMMVNAASLSEELTALSTEVRSLADPGAERAARRIDDCLQVLSDLQHGTEQVRTIISDLRVFARSDEIQPGGVDPAAAIEWALRVTASQIASRATLKRNIATVPNVRGSPTKLGQVVVNLLVNAAQAIEPDKPEQNEIEVSLGVSAGGDVELAIRDTGGGIEPAARERIFEPFFTTKPVGAGTGLGLSVCHGIVTALGGRIAVEPAAPRGTIFRIVLPPLPPPPVVSSVPAEDLAATRARVLVVDDEPLVLRSLTRVLARFHDVVSANSVAEAEAVLAADAAFDVVLCDLMMPDRTGIDFYEKLLVDSSEIAERMVFLTGGAFTPRAAEFIESVPNRFVYKPLRPGEILEVVQRVVRSKGMRSRAS